MKKRFTEQQIAFALRQAASGTSASEICRKIGVSEPTFYAWKKKFAGLGITEIRRLKQLEDENRRLKQVVAELTLDKPAAAGCRMCSQKSSEARRTPGADRGVTDGLSGQ